MRELQIIAETWPFQCLHCGQAWEEVYEACHGDDGHGGCAVAWRRRGVASMPPWADQSCPRCTSLSVKVLPSGTRCPDPTAQVPEQRQVEP
jgi:hypothetical protein